MTILSGSVLILSFGVNLLFAMLILAIVGLTVLIPDVLLATYPSDILTRKLAATATGFIVTFTSLSGIISTTVSGKIIDSFNSYGALFFSFALMAATGTVLTLLINEKQISEKTEGVAV
jgi:sugar phosphate permease